MKTILPLISIIIFTVSCSSDKNDSGKIYALEVLQTNTLEQYGSGEEKLMMLREMAADKSNESHFRSRIKQIYQGAQSIDSVTAMQLSLFEALKKELFSSFGEELTTENAHSILTYDYNRKNPARPAIYDFSQVKNTGGSSILNSENKEKIVTSIRTYRKQVCEFLEKSAIVSDNRQPYFFKDPSITDFKDQKDFNTQFDKALKQSNVAPDDLEAIRTIYQMLSKTDAEWEAIMGEKDSWIDAIAVLLSIENSVLQVRSFALNVIRARVGCGAEYGFTKILPVVYGPSAALAGDTVELQVFMAALNGDKNPVISTVSGGKVTRVENGVGYVQVIVPKAGELKVAGKLSIRNKSGVPKTVDWSHGIKAIREK